jgi:hypothetical protein
MKTVKADRFPIVRLQSITRVFYFEWEQDS